MSSSMRNTFHEKFIVLHKGTKKKKECSQKIGFVFHLPSLQSTQCERGGERERDGSALALSHLYTHIARK